MLLIPDGNRRYARREGMEYRDCYRRAASRVTDVAKWVLLDAGAERLTVYGLSYDNIAQRNAAETKPIEHAWAEEMREWAKEFPGKGIRFTARGETRMLSEHFQKCIREAEEATEECAGKEFVLLLGYSGDRDIDAAAEKSATREEFRQLLDSGKAIDAVIRTGGNRRLSNCPLYNVGYAELFFLDKYFPELSEEDVKKIVAHFNAIEGNFGK